jgi:hypothetical protein
MALGREEATHQLGVDRRVVLEQEGVVATTGLDLAVADLPTLGQ